jgi:hypothetical protein
MAQVQVTRIQAAIGSRGIDGRRLIDARNNRGATGTGETAPTQDGE